MANPPQGDTSMCGEGRIIDERTVWQLEIWTLRKLTSIPHASLLTFFHSSLKAHVAVGICGPGHLQESEKSGKKWKKVKKATTRFTDAPVSREAEITSVLTDSPVLTQHVEPTSGCPSPRGLDRSDEGSSRPRTRHGKFARDCIKLWTCASFSGLRWTPQFHAHSDDFFSFKRISFNFSLVVLSIRS